MVTHNKKTLLNIYYINCVVKDNKPYLKRT